MGGNVFPPLLSPHPPSLFFSFLLWADALEEKDARPAEIFRATQTTGARPWDVTKARAKKPPLAEGGHAGSSKPKGARGPQTTMLLGRITSAPPVIWSLSISSNFLAQGGSPTLAAPAQ